MISKYRRAYTEVLECLNYLPENEYAKIPKEKIDFYKENMDKDYKFFIDPKIDLAKQNISEEANAILISLFRDYFASERQKGVLEKILDKNQEMLEQMKREKYSVDNIFKSSN